jgi:hypothetical protein
MGHEESTAMSLVSHLRKALRFDRNEFSGAFGDIGTDFPLIVGMILVAGLDPASVLIMFGSMQLFSGIIYGLPMPVQPLKAMAVLVITQKLSAGVLYGGGLAIGVVMMILAVTGLLDWLARVVPKCVVRGIQLGLGIQLGSLALKDYIPSDGLPGWLLALASFGVAIALLGNRRFPPAPIIILLGLVYAFALNLDIPLLRDSIGLSVPRWHMPGTSDVWTGFVLLALPQIPLSLGNSILATRQIAADYFPDRPLSVRKIGMTYSLMNLINPLGGGIPTCHGSGGLAGHYAFGARTGGSVVLYGLLYLFLGFFLSGGFRLAVDLFPRPVLGVILLFEGLGLMKLMADMAASPKEFAIALMVGLLAFGLPYGYVIGLVVGAVLAYLPQPSNP